MCYTYLYNALMPAFPQCGIDKNEYEFSATFIMAIFYYVNIP